MNIQYTWYVEKWKQIFQNHFAVKYSNNISDKWQSLNRVMECTIATFTIQRGYKLIVNNNLKVGVIVKIFGSALLTKENKIFGIKVTREEDPKKSVIVQAKDIKTVIHRDRLKT